MSSSELIYVGYRLCLQPDSVFVSGFPVVISAAKVEPFYHSCKPFGCACMSSSSPVYFVHEWYAFVHIA